jgi:ribosomal protein S27E
MPKRKCIFSDSLKEQFPFIKESSVVGDCSEVECSLCCAVFSVSHGGKADIVDHVSTKSSQQW